MLGRAARALTQWLETAAIREGYLFRAITRDGMVAESLSGRGVARIVKARARKAGLDPAVFGVHSLRSGFVTEAGRKGVSRQEAMAMTGHRSGAVFDGYFQVGELMRSDAGRLADEL